MAGYPDDYCHALTSGRIWFLCRKATGWFQKLVLCVPSSCAPSPYCHAVGMTRGKTTANAVLKPICSQWGRSESDGPDCYDGYEPGVQTPNWAVVLFLGVMGIECLDCCVHTKGYYVGL